MLNVSGAQAVALAVAQAHNKLHKLGTQQSEQGKESGRRTHSRGYAGLVVNKTHMIALLHHWTADVS